MFCPFLRAGSTNFVVIAWIALFMANGGGDIPTRALVATVQPLAAAPQHRPNRKGISRASTFFTASLPPLPPLPHQSRCTPHTYPPPTRLPPPCHATVDGAHDACTHTRGW